MGKYTVLAAIDQAFGSIPRPEIMTRNPHHCDECEEHERVMKGVTPLNITLKEIGNPGWDPVCYVTDEAYRYFMPGFVRLIFSDDYLDQFIFHIESRLAPELFTHEQRHAVIQLIDFLKGNIPEREPFTDEQWRAIINAFELFTATSLNRIWDKLTAEGGQANLGDV